MVWLWKTKIWRKKTLSYLDTDSFIAYIKTNGIYKDIAEDVEARFDTSNYELNKPSPKEKNKKVTGLMKNELGKKCWKKDLVSEKKEIKCNNIIKRYKKWLTLMVLEKKT